MSKPQRIQLSRRKGWRMPPNTVKVDRTTRWGNPFLVGHHGKQVECVYWYALLMCGWSAIMDNLDAQGKAMKALKVAKKDGFAPLRGKNLACWCRVGTPCHADLLIDIVNRRGRGKPLDLDGFLAGYGYRFEQGRPYKITAATV